MKDNLDGFQKLVSTRWTFSVSISIGLDRSWLSRPPTLNKTQKYEAPWIFSQPHVPPQKNLKMTVHVALSFV